MTLARPWRELLAWARMRGVGWTSSPAADPSRDLLAARRAPA